MYTVLQSELLIEEIKSFSSSSSSAASTALNLKYAPDHRNQDLKFNCRGTDSDDAWKTTGDSIEKQTLYPL
jgi:hypothetical protein